MTERIASTNLLEFFRERVREAADHQKLHPPQAVEFYLVNLLKDYLKAEALFVPTEAGREPQALALLLAEAIKTDSHQRVRLFKKIGDLSLFTAGFFPASLQRRLVDVDYCVQMGGTAYGTLSQMVSRTPALEEIFTELASHFVSYVDILAEVSEKSAMITDTDLLRIYETWLKTGSEWAKHRLSEEGILPIPETPLNTQ